MEKITQVKVEKRVHYYLKKRASENNKFLQDELNDILKKELCIPDEESTTLLKKKDIESDLVAEKKEKIIYFNTMRVFFLFNTK